MELRNDQAFFASYKAPEMDAKLIGSAIRNLWRDFSSQAENLRYGSVLLQILSWSEKMDRDALARVPDNLRDEARQLLGYARVYKGILTELAAQSQSQLQVPAKTGAEKKERRAEAGEGSVLNQRFAEEFAQLAREPKTPEDYIRRKNALIFMDIAESLASMYPPIHLGEIIKTTFAGAKAQVVVTRLMEDHGFVTITPDWRNPSDVYMMDTHAKVDLAAYDGKRLFFLDAKSRAMIKDDDGRFTINHVGSVQQDDQRFIIYLRQLELANRLDSRIKGISTVAFEHYKIILPTHPTYVGSFGETVEPAIAKGILAGLNLK